MAFESATTPALAAAAGEITARTSSTTRPTAVESKLANGEQPHVPVGQAERDPGPKWGTVAPGVQSIRAESAAPGVTPASALPRVASPFTGIADDMAEGVHPDGRVVQYAHRAVPDTLVETGPTHDLTVQDTDNAGHHHLTEAEYKTRRQLTFPNRRQGFSQAGTAPYAEPVIVGIGQVAPDPAPSNPPGNGSLNHSKLGAIWRGSGSAYNPVPAPPDAVIVDGPAAQAPGTAMRSWG